MVKNRRVEGTYVSVTEAVTAVERLRNQGYGKNDITLVANKRVREAIPYTTDAKVTTDMTEMTDNDDRSLWEKIKDAFTMHDYDTMNYDDPTDDPMYDYREDIDRGNIVVFVDDDNDRDTTMIDDVTDPINDPLRDPTLDPIGDPTLTRDTKATDPPLKKEMDPPLRRDDDMNRPL